MVRGRGRNRTTGADPGPERPASPRGCTLLELLAALFVFAVGLLGVAGLAGTVARALSEAALRERAVAAASSVADSLAVAGRFTPGEAPFAGRGRIAWVGAGHPGDGLVQARIRAEDPRGRVLLEIDLVLDGRAGESARARGGSLAGGGSAR